MVDLREHIYMSVFKAHRPTRSRFSLLFIGVFLEVQDKRYSWILYLIGYIAGIKYTCNCSKTSAENLFHKILLRWQSASLCCLCSWLDTCISQTVGSFNLYNPLGKKVGIFLTPEPYSQPPRLIVKPRGLCLFHLIVFFYIQSMRYLWHGLRMSKINQME